MRKFTKLMLTLTLCVFGLGVANAERVYADLSKYGDKWDGTDVTFSWTAPWGNQLGPNLNEIGLPSGDLRTWQKLVVVVDELNNCDFFRVLVYSGDDTGHNNTLIVNNTGTNEFTLSGNVDFLDKVTRICLSGSNGSDSHCKDNAFDPAASFKVKAVYLERPDVVYLTEGTEYELPEGATDVNGMVGADSNPWVIAYPKNVQHDDLFGGNIDGDNKSVDINSYDYLHIVVSDATSDANCGFRVFVSTASSNDNSTRVCLYPRPIGGYTNETVWTDKYMITTPGTYVVKVSAYPLLRGFKALQDWAGNKGTITVSMMYLTSGDSPVAPAEKAVIFGAESLNDETVTGFNATALSGSGLTFNAANPNALFIANEGTLANTKNVIVNGICANLELTDQKPFKAPVDFTATAASFTKTVTDADYATLVLPFNAELPTGVEAYNATSVTNSVINTTAAESIVANKPVLLKNAGNYEFTAENVEVAAVEGVQTNGLLNGVYATTDVPTDNGYVLQNQDGNVMFFKAIDGTTVKAFRAYLAVDNADARLGFDFETTGIKKVENAAANNGEFFNLAGQRVAQPTKGLYIMNGKKFIK